MRLPGALLLGARDGRVPYGLASASGWTLVNFGAESVEVTGGAAVATLPGGSGGTHAGQARASWSMGEDWLIEAAATIEGDVGVNSLAYLWASFGDPAVSTFELAVRVDGGGSVAATRTSPFGVFGSLSGFPVDGSRRVRLAVRGQRVTAWAETDDGFVVLADLDVAGRVGVAPPVALAASGQVEGPALATATTISWRGINGWGRAAQ